MNNCPCCSQQMLRHISHNRIYWYCQSCHQEMPNFEKICTQNTIIKSQRLILKEYSF